MKVLSTGTNEPLIQTTTMIQAIRVQASGVDRVREVHAEVSIEVWVEGGVEVSEVLVGREASGADGPVDTQVPWYDVREVVALWRARSEN